MRNGDTQRIIDSLALVAEISTSSTKRARYTKSELAKLKRLFKFYGVNKDDCIVGVLEVEHLIKSLKADNKKFDYEIFQDIPGGHSFDRMDTKHAREVRVKIYKFLGQYLKPPKQINTVRDLEKAAYKIN